MAYGSVTVSDVYDSVLTTSLREYIPKMHDNIFSKIPFFQWLSRNGKVKHIDGGYEIVVPIMYENNSTVGWYSNDDELDTSPQDGMTVARYGWKQLAISIAIDRKSERQNAGKHKLISLLDSKVTQAENTVRQEISRRLFAGLSTSTYTTYTGTSWDAAKHLPSLDAFMPHAAGTNPTSQTTNDYGTIGYLDGEASQNTWWRAVWNDCAATTTLATLTSDLVATYNSCYKGSGIGYPDLILTSQEMMQVYEQVNSATVTYTNRELADLGFQNLKFKGATMMWDPYHAGLAANDEALFYFINSEHLYLVVDSQTDFITTPFYRPPNQDARVCQILWMGNLVCNNRRALGCVQGTA